MGNVDVYYHQCHVQINRTSMVDFNCLGGESFDVCEIASEGSSQLLQDLQQKPLVRFSEILAQRRGSEVKSSFPPLIR